MSIQSFTEELISGLEKTFENEANKLLNESRQRTGNESYIAGRMDGLSDAVKHIHDIYSLFVKPDSDSQDDDAKPLY